MQTLDIHTRKHLQAVTLPIPLALGCSETLQGPCAKVLNLPSQEISSGLCNPVSSKCTFSFTRRRLNCEPGAESKNSSPKHKGCWLYLTFTAFCGVSLGSLCLQPLGPQQTCLFLKCLLLHLILFFVIMKLQVQSEIFWEAHLFLYERPVLSMYFLPHCMAHSYM